VCAVYAAHAADVEGDFFIFFLTHFACLDLSDMLIINQVYF